MVSALVFVIDDEVGASRLERVLERDGGWQARPFGSAAAVRAAARERHPDAIVVRWDPGDEDGRALLAELRAADPHLVAVVLTAPGDQAGAADAIAAVGPLHQMTGPADAGEVVARLRAGLERRQLARALGERDSELATATERLIHAEQLAAVGRVVTGIAHELDRQLALINYAEAIKARVADDPELSELADIIVHAQKRLASMVDEIRDFVAGVAAPGTLEREPADVGAVVDEALAIIGYDPDVRARTIERVYLARPLAALHRQKFSQVVMNLVSNAVLATGPGERISVELDVADDGAFAVLTVRDDGVGMAPEVLARLGEPFFSTRAGGSGLGVGICMRIVEDHGGRLTFESARGSGTRARVVIPAIADSAAAERR